MPAVEVLRKRFQLADRLRQVSRHAEMAKLVSVRNAYWQRGEGPDCLFEAVDARKLS
jgi:hypothetical protein